MYIVSHLDYKNLIVTDIDLLCKKETKTFQLTLPAQEEYVRDIEKLTSRLIPYNQVKREVLQILRNIGL